MTETWDDVAESFRKQAATEQRPFPVSDRVANALRGFMERHAEDYEGDRLRVGPDLKPDGEGCDRATWLRLTGAKQDKITLAKLIRYLRGRKAERLMAKAFKHAGYKILAEIETRPLRPSAWAWGDGHGDVLDVEPQHLYEIKAPGLDAWRRAGVDPSRLVRESYRWQLSRYVHELRRTGLVKTASWLFIDWEGEHEPAEVPLTDDLLVPLDAIVALEDRKSRLLSLTDAPPRPTNTLEIVKILKGGRATKKNPRPERRVTAVERRFWGCSFCNYVGTCQPGPEETPVELAADDPRRVEAVREAEATWAREDVEKKAAKNGNEASAAPQAGEAGSAVGQVPAVRDAGDDAALRVSDARPVPGADSVSQNNGAGASPSPAADAIPPTPVGEVSSTPAANPPCEAAPPAVSEAPPLHVLPPDRSPTREAAGSSLSQRETTDARPEWMRVYARALATADDVQLTEASGHAVKHEGPEW